ncbi:ribonuclease R [Blastopirellula sp. JC732]|uniref:Ribonuclease R n=1 Tax=Blastopirellula sediminis TaxID=2894196 RepID=A0A9X1MSW6_9BACT|nr:ribonuclease R [Blastopirellula sediminis]MCC9605208.1 ribonuclease R [Blastopirellula sediminis]MCC9631492.1 ribonuclease R [Blastopirellula sediminis]
MELEQLEQTLLAHIQKSTYQPVKPKVIAKQLNVAEEDLKTLKRAIKRLLKKGHIVYGASHLIKRANADSGKTSKSIVGHFHRTAKGFGFVRPLGTPKSAEKTADIYVPAKRTADAATGDTVRIRLFKMRGSTGESKICGEVIEIVERETHRFVGTYSESHGYALVQVDGNVFTQPILVGDPGVKGARVDDKVVIEIVRFPSHFHDGEGVIVEVLGARGAPGVDLLSVMREYDLPQEFPEAALEVAREMADNFDESIGEGRRDITDETIITIDPFDARDFDDAISLTRLENGHWLLGVHIADVSHFVPEGSALDVEARNRATSIYLPDKVIPMLPEIISNNLASLQPDKVRYAKTARIEFTPDGARVHTEVFKSAIKSKRRFTYEEVDEYLEDRDAWKEKITPQVHKLLADMHELAMMLRERRFQRGSIELIMPELKLDLDKDGQVTGAHVEKNTESHQIIEEFMLSANEAVAEKLHDKELFFLRRVHDSPEPNKLEALTEFVRDVGIECDSLHSRFEIIRVLDKVKGLPEQAAVNYATLRSMKKAVYSPEEIGHYALASECYCHFTSPIRRYPDLTIHRMYNDLDAGKRPVQDYDAMMAEGEHCSEREQRAANSERDLVKIKLLNHLSQKIGMEMEAVITGVESFGLFVQGLQLPADGLIHIDSLQDDYYRYDRTTHSLVGNRGGNAYRLGDVLKVAIARVDLEKRELDFRLIEFESHAGSQNRRPPTSGRTASDDFSHGRGKPAKQKHGGKSHGGKGKSKKRKR